jgi:hypothetical protein
MSSRKPWPSNKSRHLDVAGNYLHELPGVEAHHCHREAPPDQQDAGSSLKLEADVAGCEAGGAAGGRDASATLGPSTALIRGRASEDSFAARGMPFAAPASSAPLGLRGPLADALASASMRRGGGPSRGGGGKPLAMTDGLLRKAGGMSGKSP